jgi:hypothetical protein
MEPYFTEYTDHKPEDLHLKSVEFEIAYGDENPTRGFGVLHARKNPKKQVCLEVRLDVDGPGPNQKSALVYAQTARTRFRVERHPNPDVAAFRLSSYTLPPSSPKVEDTYEFQ